jgi:hypothetical protein
VPKQLEIILSANRNQVNVDRTENSFGADKIRCDFYMAHDVEMARLNIPNCDNRLKFCGERNQSLIIETKVQE